MFVIARTQQFLKSAVFVAATLFLIADTAAAETSTGALGPVAEVDSAAEIVEQKTIKKKWYYSSSDTSSCFSYDCEVAFESFSNRFILINFINCYISTYLGSEIVSAYLLTSNSRYIAINVNKYNGSSPYDYHSATLETNFLLKRGESAKVVIETSGAEIYAMRCSADGEAFKY